MFKESVAMHLKKTKTIHLFLHSNWDHCWGFLAGWGVSIRISHVIIFF